MTATPTPGDLSARHVEVLRRMRAAVSDLLALGPRRAHVSLHEEDAALDYAIAANDWRHDVCDRLGMETACGATWTPLEVFQHVRELERRAALSALPAAGGLEERHYLAAWEAARSLTHIAGMAHVGKAWKDMADAASKGVYAVFGEAVDADWHGRTPWLTTPQPSAAEVAYPTGEVVGPCVCGSWPGGRCFRCKRIPPDAAVGAQGDGDGDAPKRAVDLFRTADKVAELFDFIPRSDYTDNLWNDANEEILVAAYEMESLRRAAAERLEFLNFFKPPFRAIAKQDAYSIVDATGAAVAMMMWPCHPPEDTHAAELETWRLAQAFAGIAGDGVADALAAPAAGKGVDDAMVERACAESWPEARFTVEAMTDWPHADPLRRGHHQRVVRAALEAALTRQPGSLAERLSQHTTLTRQPVAGGGMVLVPREVRDLYEFMALVFAPMTSQQEQIAIALKKAKAAMRAAPAATPTDGGEGKS